MNTDKTGRIPAIRVPQEHHEEPSSMPSIITNPQFRIYAVRLHQRCAERGLRLRDGAAEAFLAQRIRAVADVMRISDRHALRRYIDDHAIDRLVDVIADGADRLHAAIDAASPLLLPVPQAARVTAALGQVACWARINSANDPQQAAALIETAATAVTEWAMAIERAGTDQVALIGADTAVRTRHALETFADKARHRRLEHPAATRRR
jgi:hypothetical protein